MNGLDSTTAFWLVVAFPCFGVLSAWAARLSEGSVCQAVSQWVFYVALGLAGTATAVALMVGLAIWAVCAVLLAVMVLTATCDFGARRETAVE